MFRILIGCLIALHLSCRNNNCELNIKNEYNGKIDSLVFGINFKTVSKLENIRPALDTTIQFSTVGIAKQHDVLIYAVLYNQHQAVDSFLWYDDLNAIIPKTTVIRITDTLRLKCSIIP